MGRAVEEAEGRARQTRRESCQGIGPQDYWECFPLPMLFSVQFGRQFQPLSHPIESCIYGQFMCIMPILTKTRVKQSARNFLFCL